MYQFIITQPVIVFYILLTVSAIIVSFLSYKLGIFSSNYKNYRIIKKLEKEKSTFHKENRKMWDEEKNTLTLENHRIKEKLENYRKKISGLGMLSFGGSKKRSDILYSLLMENEMLEQILHKQTQKLATEQKANLDQRLLDINKRQRLLAEIFDDKKIKDYVQEVLESENLTKKITEK